MNAHTCTDAAAYEAEWDRYEATRNLKALYAAANAAADALADTFEQRVVNAIIDAGGCRGDVTALRNAQDALGRTPEAAAWRAAWARCMAFLATDEGKAAHESEHRN
jgi:hypothetical protein